MTCPWPHSLAQTEASVEGSFLMRIHSGDKKEMNVGAVFSRISGLILEPGQSKQVKVHLELPRVGGKGEVSYGWNHVGRGSVGF